MTRATASWLAALAVATAALAGPACDRVVDLTPQQDARAVNDGEPPPDTGPSPDAPPPPDALGLDALAVALDAGVGIDGAAAAGEPGR